MSEQKWDLVIDAEKRNGRASSKDIWRYRDLLWLLVRRDFVSFYKQTVVGPIWFFIKPVFSSLVYLFVFGKLAGLSSDGIPPVLFYLSGVTAWSFFSETVGTTSNVLTANAAIFGKVYFPRLIMPISITFSALIKVGIQMILIALMFIFYLITTDELTLTPTIFLLPVIITVIALQAFGVGLFVAAVSIKYRDISMLIGYVLQLGLFVTPVVYPLSSLTGKLRLLAVANPMSYPLELFRYSFFGTGSFTTVGLLYMVMVTLVLFLIGIYAFNKAEKTFVDTV